MNKIVGILVLTAFGPAARAGLTPYALEAEALRNPIGIDAPRPRLGWKLRSSARGDHQVAYQIIVSSSKEKAELGQADIWDSRRIESPETAWISYAGPALQSFSRYWWSVRVWDGSNTPSSWSQPAEWTTSVLRRQDWKASWIHYPDDRLTAGPLPIFRKEITLEKPVRRVLAAISGVGFHELRVNGTKAGDHVLAPAWTNYKNTVLYETLDVTPLVKPGVNAVGILIGNGFFNVPGGRYTKYTGSFGHPRLLFQLHIQYQDGAIQDVGSDSSWRAHHGPLTFSCIYGGEDFDARLEPEGWDRPGFDDSQWEPVRGGEGAGGDVRAQSSPPIRVQQTLRTVAVTQPRPGIWVYDLGQNFAGWPRIEVSGTAGAQVRLTPGELLDGSGLVSQRSSGGPQSFNYTLRGAGRESWSPRFSYYGFRFVQVEGAAPESSPIAGVPVLHRLEGQFIHLDAPRVGQFECSSELLNRVHALIDAAVRSNLQHVLTDCPHREKLGWLEQLYLMGPSLLYNWDLRTFLPKAVRDMREAQTAAGLVPGIAPEYVVFGWGHEGFRDSPEWGSAAVFVPWLAWRWYGDRTIVEQGYRPAKRYVEYLGSRANADLLRHGLGDWYDIGPGAPGVSQLTPLGLTATATWFADLQTLEREAMLLGRDADARDFATQADRVRESFQHEFFRPTEGTYANSSQTSIAMPLVLGLAPETFRGSLVDRLIADIRAKGNHTTAGDVGYTYVVRALQEANRSDVLFDMATRTDAPSYGAQLAAGATSLTEAWDANPDSSQNHLMLGHIEQWFYAGLAGIRPLTDPGTLRRIEIRPEIVGDLSSVHASWDSFRGPVEVQWRIEGHALRLGVKIPPGVTAAVYVPGGAADRITEGGRAASTARGIRFVRQDARTSVFEIDSGAYDFTVEEFRQ